MSVRRILLIILLFLTVLTVFRLTWFQLFAAAEHPHAVKGVLDLRNWDQLSQHTVSLEGEWEFYPHFFYQPEQKNSRLPAENKETIQVPGNWNFSNEKVSTYGYGTYRLRILTDPSKEEFYALHFPEIHSSAAIFINGELFAHSGKVGTGKQDYEPMNIPKTLHFAADNGEEIEIVIQAANYDDLFKGGIVKAPIFGLAGNMEKTMDIHVFNVISSCIIYLLHSFYSFTIFLLGRHVKNNRQLLYFSLIGLLVILATLMSERLLYVWLPLNYEWSIKTPNLGLIAGGYVVLQLIKQQLPQALLNRWFKPYIAVMGVLAVLVAVLPVQPNIVLTPIINIVTLIPCLLGVFIMYKFVLPVSNSNIFLLLGIISAVYSFIWLIVIQVFNIHMISYPFDLLITIICFAIYFFKQYFITFENREQIMLELQEADKRKDNFLVAVAHEIRNPLHSMLNISQTVITREKNSMQEDSIRDLELSVNVARRMSMLLNDLLDLERLKENQFPIQMQEVSVHSVAESVADMLRFMAEGKNIKLVNRIPTQFPKVIADENRLNQILFNLLHNALKFTQKGEISVQASFQDDLAKISVKDSGIGIEETFLSQLFEPYKQDHSVIVPNEGGIGIGLSICKQLVELQGGRLEVSSKVNEGSEFTFTLRLASSSEHIEQLVKEPLYQAGEQIATAREAMNEKKMAAKKQNGTDQHELIRIMAVDDDPVNLKVLESIFSFAQYEVHAFTNGEDALLMLDKGNWDLVIVDVMMPKISGYELTSLIRKKYPISELPILLLTAYNREEGVEAGFHAGANDYVAKPINAVELISRAESLVNQKRAFREQLRMEAAWLQAQIKPHFMINALNSIVALSRIDLDRMDDLIEELSNYIRLSIGFQNSNGLASLERELELVRSYIFIQQERFQDRIQVIWDIDDSIQINIPPLTIQPLVENAISHGILKRVSGGEIRIYIKDEGESISITVEDNGVGMNKEQIFEIMEIREDKRTGIGLLNTDRRLKQHYGTGLIINSEIGTGTAVSFKIPKE